MESQIRSKLSTGENKRIRASGFVPAVVYGNKKEPLYVSIPKDAIKRGDRYFYTTPIDLKIPGIGTTRVLPKEVQLHPVTGAFLHLDFIRLESGGRLKVRVPVELMNVATSKGTKMGGVVTLLQKHVPVSCPEKNIPRSIKVDVKNLEVGESIRISQLQLPEECIIFGVAHQPVVSISGSGKQESDADPTKESESESEES